MVIMIIFGPESVFFLLIMCIMRMILKPTKQLRQLELNILVSGVRFLQIQNPQIQNPQIQRFMVDGKMLLLLMTRSIVMVVRIWPMQMIKVRPEKQQLRHSHSQELVWTSTATLMFQRAGYLQY